MAEPPNLPGYRLLEKLGQGSFGAVYKAQHVSGEVLGCTRIPWLMHAPQVVAVKCIQTESESESQTMQEIQREIAILERSHSARVAWS